MILPKSCFTALIHVLSNLLLVTPFVTLSSRTLETHGLIAYFSQLVGADNVGSKQMQQIRMSLRGSAVVLMGKTTMMRKVIKGHLERNTALEKLSPHIRGNVGFVFTCGDLVKVRDKLLENKMRAPARPLSVIIPAQNPGLGPEKTSIFQALSIPTKISKGSIEIINGVHILKPGDKVGASEATLLNMLNISPFSYGLLVEQVYDSGTIFAPEILDIKPEDLSGKFLAGVANLASVCLSMKHRLSNNCFCSTQRRQWIQESLGHRCRY